MAKVAAALAERRKAGQVGTMVERRAGKKTGTVHLLSRSAVAATMLSILVLPLPAGAQAPAPPQHQSQPPLPAAPRQDEATASLLRSVAIAGIVIAAAGVTLGSITGGLSFAKTADLGDVCDDDDVCPADQQDAIDDAQLLSNLSNLGFITGGLGLAMGLTALLSIDDAEDESAAAVRFVPLLGPAAAGVSVSIPLL